MQMTSYPAQSRNPSPDPKLDTSRPRNPRDDRHAVAWMVFRELVAAASAGRPSRASDLATSLVEQGYGVEQMGEVGYRLLLPERRTA